MSDHTITVYKPIKDDWTTEFNTKPALTFTANVQQSSFDEVAMGLNSNPAGREWTIRGNVTEGVKPGDKLVDQNNIVYIARSVHLYKSKYLSYLQILGVQDGT